MAMDAIVGVSMANLQSGRIIRVLASPETSSRESIVKSSARGRLNFRCEGIVFRSCNPMLFSDRLGGRLPAKRGIPLQIRASQGENVLPLPLDNGVATLESLLDATPACPPSKKDDRSEHLEALIERVRVCV